MPMEEVRGRVWHERFTKAGREKAMNKRGYKGLTPLWTAVPTMTAIMLREIARNLDVREGEVLTGLVNRAWVEKKQLQGIALAAALNTVIGLARQHPSVHAGAHDVDLEIAEQVVRMLEIPIDLRIQQPLAQEASECPAGSRRKPRRRDHFQRESSEEFDL